MNLDNWDDPQEFRPDRWIGNDGKIIKSDAFIPFSIGPRICPGESLSKNEIFIFCCTLLQRFTFRVEDQSQLPSLEGNAGMTLSPCEYLVIPEPR